MQDRMHRALNGIEVQTALTWRDLEIVILKTRSLSPWIGLTDYEEPGDGSQVSSVEISRVE